MDRVLRALMIGCVALTFPLPFDATVRAAEGGVATTDQPPTWQLPIRVPRVDVPKRLGEELIERCLAVADEIDAAYGRRLRQLRIGSEEAFVDHLRRSRRLFELAELKRRDSARYQLELIQIRADAAVERMSHNYRRAVALGREETARSTLEQLRDSVRLQLGLELHDREDYLCRVQEVVNKLEQQFEQEKTQFNTLVEQRVERLVEGTRAVPDDAGSLDGAISDHLHTRGVCPDLDEDLIDQFLDLAHDIDSSLASQLRTLRDRDPAAFADRLCDSRRLYDLARLRRHDPQLYRRKLLELNLHAQVDRLAEKVVAARRDGRTEAADSLREELHKWVIAEMGLSLLTRQEYLVRLQELVQQIEQQIQQKRSSFDTLVAERIDRIKADAPSPASTAASGRAPEDAEIPPE